MRQLSFPERFMPPVSSVGDKKPDRHYHLWVIEDDGALYPTVAHRKDDKFRTAAQAKRAALRYGCDPKNAMARACDC